MSKGGCGGYGIGGVSGAALAGAGGPGYPAVSSISYGSNAPEVDSPLKKLLLDSAHMRGNYAEPKKDYSQKVFDLAFGRNPLERMGDAYSQQNKSITYKPNQLEDLLRGYHTRIYLH